MPVSKELTNDRQVGRRSGNQFSALSEPEEDVGGLVLFHQADMDLDSIQPNTYQGQAEFPNMNEATAQRVAAEVGTKKFRDVVKDVRKQTHQIFSPQDFSQMREFQRQFKSNAKDIAKIAKEVAKLEREQKKNAPRATFKKTEGEGIVILAAELDQKKEKDDKGKQRGMLVHAERMRALAMRKQRVVVKRDEVVFAQRHAQMESHHKAVEGMKKKKTEYVVESGAAWLLRNHSMKGAHPKEVKRLKANARTWVEDYNHTVKKRGTNEIGTFSSGLALNARGKAVADMESLEEVLRGVRDPKHRNKLLSLYSAWNTTPKLLKNKSYLDTVAKEFASVASKSTFRGVVKLHESGIEIQGNLPSAPRGHIVNLKVGTMPVPVELPLMSDLLWGFEPEWPETLVRITISFSCMVGSCVECNTPGNIAANLINFMVSHFPTGFMTALSVHLTASLKGAFSDWKWKGPAGSFAPLEVQGDNWGQDVMSGIKTSDAAFDDFSQSVIGRSMWDVMSTVSLSAMMLAMGFPEDLNLIVKIKKFMDTCFRGKEGTDNFIDKCCRFMSVTASKFKEAIEKRDFSILFSKTDVREWMFLSTTLLDDPCILLDQARPAMRLTFADKLEKGELPHVLKTQITSAQRLCLIDGALKEAVTYEKVAAGSDDRVLQVSLEKLRLRLESMKYSLESRRANGEFRVEPFGVFIHGPPGVGKSEFTGVLHRAFGAKRRLPATGETRFDYLRASNFYDTANGAQWFAVLDDIDQSLGSTAYADKKHPEVVVELINKKPLEMEQAAVDKKGQIFCNLLSVVYCTNYKDARLQNFIREPMAFWRRFAYAVGFEVKKKYATEKGMLCPDKLDGSNDYWEFTIGQFDDSLWDDSNKYTSFPFQEAKCDSLSYLVRELTNSFDAKVTRELDRLGLAENRRDKNCLVCYIPFSMHPAEACDEPKGCVHEHEDEVWKNLEKELEVQGGGISKMRLDVLGPKCDPACPLTVREQVAKTNGNADDRLWAILQSCVDTMYHAKWIIASLGVVSVSGMMIAAAVKAKRGKTVQVVPGVIAKDPQALVQVGPMKQVPELKLNFVRSVFERTPLDEKSLSTTSLEQLDQMVLKRIFTIRTNVAAMMCVQLYGTVFLVPGHALISATDALSIADLRKKVQAFTTTEARFERGAFSYSMTISNGVNAVCAPGREWFLVNVVGVTPTSDHLNLLKHIVRSSPSNVAGIFEKVHFLTLNSENEGVVYVAESGRYILEKGSVNSVIQYFGLQTAMGSCGSVVTAKCGESTYIAGYHLIMAPGMGCFGEELVQSELLVAIEKLSKLTIIVPQVRLSSFEVNANASRRLEDVEIVPLPERSSLWVAVGQGYKTGQVLGTLKHPFPMAGNRTKCFRTPMAPAMAKLELEVCGKTPYFVPPNGKGKMVDGVWVDPFTVNLAGHSNVPGNEVIWKEALEDFLFGHEQLLGYEDVRVLTDREVIFGIPGLVNPLNLKTSMGPPFHVRKKEHVTVNHVTGEFMMSPEMRESIEVIRATLSVGSVYVPTCVHSLKDEAVSVDKNEMKKIRVFNTMSAAYNFLLKKYTAMLCVFIRRNWKFFETAIGKNVNSMDLEQMVYYLQEVNESLDRVEDGDWGWYDLTKSSVLKLHGRRALETVLSRTPLTHDDQEFASLLLAGSIYTIRNIKNDLVLCAHGEPSGGNMTIDNNDVDNSMTFRYAFHARRRALGLPFVRFRDMVRLLLMGDDNLYAKTTGCEWFSGRVVAHYAKEIGMFYTAADKSFELGDPKKLEECTFMKRGFRFELGRWRAPIILKSIVKMLVCARRGELSVTDHAAVLITNASSELFFHGEIVFNNWTKVLRECAAECGADRSSLYSILEFSEYERKFQENSYPRWMVADRSAFQQSARPALVVLQLAAMSVQSQPQTGSQVDQIIGESEVNTLAVGQAVVEDGEMTTDRKEMWKSLNATTLGGYLKRMTRITNGNITSSDANLTPLFSINPTSLFLNNTQVFDKITTFGVIRGTLEVTMVTTVPSNAFGLYLLQALPEGGGAPYGPGVGAFYEVGGDTVDTPYTATQGIHGFIDIASSNAVVLKLPFVYKSDAILNTISAPDYGDPWRLVLWSLSGLQNSVNSAAVTGSYVVYARLMDDYELGMPVIQGDTEGRLTTSFSAKVSKAKAKVSQLRQDKTVSKTAAAIAKGAAFMGTAVPFLAPLAGPIAAGAAAVTSLADYFGFTKEARPEDPQSMKVTRHTNLVNVDGFDGSDVVALFSNNATTIDATVGGGESGDETSIASLYSRWTIVDQFNWSTSDAGGTILRTIPVTPFHCANTLGAWYPTVAGYIGMPFTFWRGGMEYRIFVPSSAFHRGELQILWDYAPPSTPYSEQPDNIIPNVTIDATSSTTVDVSVAYNVPDMCLRNIGLMSSTSAPLTLSGTGIVNGYLVFRVFNPLQATVGDSTISVVVMARACPDMRFGVPRSSGAFTYGASLVPFNDMFQLQGNSDGAIGDAALDTQKFSLVGDGNNDEAFPVDAVLWGEQWLSVRALAQRFSRVACVATEVSTVAAYPHFFPPPSVYATGVIASQNGLQLHPPWTWFAHYASLFVGVRGSMRWKFLSDAPSTAITSAVPGFSFDVATTAAQHSFTNSATPTGVLVPGATSEGVRVIGESGLWEVTMPYYDTMKFWPYRWVGSLGLANWQRTDIFQTLNWNGTLTAFVAGGPDLALVRFRRTPALIARTSDS
jgi:hypothetical protein